MSAHAATRPRRLRIPAAWGLPVLLGLAFGATPGSWTATGRRAHSAIILGVVGAAVAVALCLAIGRVQARLPMEAVAALYGAMLGSAMGYLNGWPGPTPG